MRTTTRLEWMLLAVGMAVLGLVMVYGVARAQQASNYDHAVVISITNNTGAALDSTAIVAGINALNLVNQGMISSDGQDKLVLFGGVEVSALAQNMASNNADWWFPVTTPLAAGASRSWVLYIGQNTTAADNPQALRLYGATEGVDVADAASLDITSNLVVEATVTFDALPGSTPTVTFAQAYTNTHAILDIALDIIVPIGDPGEEAGDATTVTTVGSQTVVFTYSEARTDFDTAATETSGGFPLITFNGSDEQLDTPDAAYFSFGDGSSDEVFTLGFWVSFGDDAGNNIVWAKYPTGGKEWFFQKHSDESLNMSLYDDSVGAGSSSRTCPAASVTIDTEHHIVVTYDGSGGNNAADGVNIYVDGVACDDTTSGGAGTYVAMEDLTGLPALMATNAGANWCDCVVRGGPHGPFITLQELTPTEVNDLYVLQRDESVGADVDQTIVGKAGAYELILRTGGVLVAQINDTTEVTYGTLVADTEYAIQMRYDGVILSLHVDGASVAADNVTRAITTNAASVIVAGDGFEGVITRVRVGDTNVAAPSWRLDLQYEPDQVAETQAGTAGNDWVWLGTVADQSTESNDGTYIFLRDMSDITVTVGAAAVQVASTAGTTTESVPTVFVTALGGSVEDPFGDSFTEGNPFTFPLTLFTDPLSDSDFPPMLFASMLIMALAGAAWIGVFGITRIPGFAHIVGAMVVGMGLFMTPAPRVVVILVVMMLIAMLKLQPRTFERA